MATYGAMDAIAEAVSLIGSPSFGSEFYRIADRLLGIDHCTIFVTAVSGPRAILAEAGSPAATNLARALAGEYVRGGYRNDPVWQRCGGAPRPECYPFFLSPSELPNESYRKEFYGRPNIGHELAVTSDMNGSKIYLGFYRENGRENFSRDCISMLDGCGSALMHILHKHVEIGSAGNKSQPIPDAQPVSSDYLYDRVRSALCAGHMLLTAREAEICASIVLGYTIFGISMNLGISTNTVATHRKRAYAKLRVSSQNELFARYFSLVESSLGAPHRV